VLQCAVCCSVLQCVAVSVAMSSGQPKKRQGLCTPIAPIYSVLQCVAVCCSVLQCVAVYCSVLQCVSLRVVECLVVCVAVCCSVLQCTAVCCSVLQCVL